MGMLKKPTSGILAIFPGSRTGSTLRVSKGVRPGWRNVLIISETPDIGIVGKRIRAIPQNYLTRSYI
jgi:hypothetical protein